MEKILVLNAGSTTVKFQLFEMESISHNVIIKGVVERIGQSGSFIKITNQNNATFSYEEPVANHQDAIKAIVNHLMGKYLKNASDLSAVGHRLGYGGEYFDSSVVIDDEVMKKIYDTVPLLPLHGAAFVHSIEAMQQLLPGVMQIASFDTAFHQTVKKTSYLYAIPLEYYKKENIRRNGFHGISHSYIAKQMAKRYGKNCRFITCHLGGGGSVTAVKDGKSIATSMGFVPSSGIIMATRAGDMDPYIPLHIMKSQNKTADEVNAIINKESGLYGLSGGHTDMRDIVEQAQNGNEQCQFTIDAYVYNILKTVGAYIALLEGIDALVFTAGIGENCTLVRQKLCQRLQYLGLEINEDSNNNVPKNLEISTPNSKVKVLVIPTNEELKIAEESFDIIEKQSLEKEAV